MVFCEIFSSKWAIKIRTDLGNASLEAGPDAMHEQLNQSARNDVVFGTQTKGS